MRSRQPRDSIAAAQIVIPVEAVKRIVAGVPGKRVVAQPAINNVSPFAAGNMVISVVSRQRIASIPAVNHVVAGPALDHIVAVAPEKEQAGKDKVGGGQGVNARDPDLKVLIIGRADQRIDPVIGNNQGLESGYAGGCDKADI